MLSNKYLTPMKNPVIKIASLFIILSSFTGCKKLQQKWIVGEWQLETVYRDGVERMWVFNDDNTLLLIKDPNLYGSAIDTLEGSWAIKSKLGNYVEVSGISSEMIDGKYYIDKMNSKLMILTRREFISGKKEGAYLRRELYK
jgi:hypothetical protein